MSYEAVWYNGWIEPPAYILLDEVEGDTPEQALLNNLDHLTQRVRRIYQIVKDEWDDDDIQESLYIFNYNDNMSVYKLKRAGLL